MTAARWNAAGQTEFTLARAVVLFRVAALTNIALIGGALLSLTSHLHSAQAGARVGYGAYLGIVMAHFVVDGGLWRLRDRFPRSFLAARLPYLLPDRAVPDRAVPDRSREAAR